MATTTSHFEIVGEIESIETIAVGTTVHDLPGLRKQYGPGRWRKLKGAATIRLFDGTMRKAEVHWCDAHGVGKRKFKIKRYLD